MRVTPLHTVVRRFPKTWEANSSWQTIRTPVQRALLHSLLGLVTLAYVSESTVLRALKDAQRRGVAGAALAMAAAKITCEEAATQAESLARQCLVAMGESSRLQNLKSLLERQFENILTGLESIAARLVESERLVV